MIGYSDHCPGSLGFLTVCWEVGKGWCLGGRHTWLHPREVGTYPRATGLQASHRQAGRDAPELSNNWEVASTWCEVKQGQLLLLGDLARTPTGLCKHGHSTAGGTDSAGPSLSLLVHPACFSSPVPSVNVDSPPGQTRRELYCILLLALTSQESLGPAITRPFFP